MSDTASTTIREGEPGHTPPVPARRSRSRLVFVVTALAVVLAGVVTGLVVTSDPNPTTHTYLIPLGTADRVAAGQEITILPDVLELRRGDRMVITNDDDVVHTIGPYTIRPSEVFDVTYSRVGVYPGPCTFNNDGRTIISVT